MLEREFQNGQYVGGYLYWTKAAEQPEWPSPLPVFTESKENETFAVDRSGHLHFIGRNLFENAANPEQPEFYQTTPGITQQTSHHAIHQTVTIPADMHQPTLAFLYQLQGSAKGTSSLRMYVTAPLTGSVPVSASHTLSSTNNLTSTIVFSTSQSVGWTHAWADLGSWAGQQITITFEITQAADDTYIRALLDEITLTPWLTPAPKQLTPAHLEAGVGATLVISGANFVATPVVELNNTLLTDVQWFNATTLQASVPSALDPGIYDLWVTNPSGQSSVRPGALAIGKQVYLPFIGR